MRTPAAVLALALALALPVAFAPSAAHAATAASAQPKPPNIPFIGPDGVSSVGTGTDQRTNPLRDINTGKPTFATPQPKLGWLGVFGMIGIGAGGTMPEMTEGMCNEYANNPTLRAHCAPYMTTEGMTAQQGMFNSGAPAFNVPGTGNGPIPAGQVLSPEACGTTITPQRQCMTNITVDFVKQGTTGNTYVPEIRYTVHPTASFPTGTGALTLYTWYFSQPDNRFYLNQKIFTQAQIRTGFLSGHPLNRSNDFVYAMALFADNTTYTTLPYIDMTPEPRPATQSVPFHWVADSHPLYVHPAGDSATGIIEVEVECINGDESQIITASNNITTRPGQPFDMPQVVCPTGWTAVGTGVGWTPSGGGEKQSIIDRTEDQLGPGVRDMVANQPDCFNGLQQCVLELRQLVAGQLLSCGSVGQLCADWASNPNATNIYKCYYGGVAVDLNLCSAYRAPNIGVLPNTDKDGNVLPYTAPIPGNLPGPMPGGLPGSAPDLRGECAARKAPSFWEGGFSPYWIYEGARCAMIEVFVPRSGVIQAKAATVQAAWAKTPPGLVIDYVEGLQEELPSVGGCLGPRVAFTIDLGPIYVVVDEYPLAACDGVPAFAANSARTLGALAMLASTAAALTRYVGSVVNAPQLGKS